MNKDFTLNPEALELKQLGFDEPCFAFYQVEYHENSPIMVDDDKQYLISGFRTCRNSEIPNHYISAPTYSQCFRWFREEHKLIAGIFPNNHSLQDNVSYIGYVGKFKKGNVEVYETYEEAEKACLVKLIEIVKEGKNENI
jgi:hypothetical protein